jgi:hypothetical protein
MRGWRIYEWFKTGKGKGNEIIVIEYNARDWVRNLEI